MPIASELTTAIDTIHGSSAAPVAKYFHALSYSLNQHVKGEGKAKIAGRTAFLKYRARSRKLWGRMSAMMFRANTPEQY